MTLISVLIVFALEFYFGWWAEYRSFGWFLSLQEKLEGMFGGQAFFESWGGVALILLLPVTALWLVVNLFSGLFYWLFLFLASCVVLFLSFGPKPLFASFETYLDAVERGDNEAAYLALQEESGGEDVFENEALIRNATNVIFVESQNRYFGVIFWFVVLGPFGALFYRLAHQYYKACKHNGRDEHFSIVSVLLHWIDWAPARVTSLLFLLAGDFMNGLYRVKDYFADLTASNRHMVSDTGISALGLDGEMESDDSQKIYDPQENYDSLALVKRTLIIYLVVVAALSPLAFW